MTTCEKCRAVCWVCGKNFETVKLLDLVPGRAIPPVPACPDCGAHPRFGSDISDEQSKKLLDAFLRGQSLDELAFEIEGSVTNKNELDCWIQGLGQARRMRVEKLKEQGISSPSLMLRPQTKAFYDDSLFSQNLLHLKELALLRMFRRKERYLAQK